MIVDLHNHLLPGIDDGAPNMLTALELAKMAVVDGITHMVCTPHIHLGRYDNDARIIQRVAYEFQRALHENNIPLEIAFGAEVRICPEIVTMLKERKLPFIGEWEGRPVLLLELPSNSIPVGTDKMIDWLVQEGVTPMIAHPERNHVLQQQEDKLGDLIAAGCLTQVTAGSVLGNFGVEAKYAAMSMIKKDMVTVLASDAHNARYRPPQMKNAVHYLASEIGSERAIQLVLDNPYKIAQSQFYA